MSDLPSTPNEGKQPPASPPAADEPSLVLETPVARAVRSDAARRLRARTRRKQQFPLAALTGALAGLLAVAFQGALTVAEESRFQLSRWAQPRGLLGLLILMAVGALGSGVSVWLTRRLAREASGSGIPHLKAVLERVKALLWRRVIPVKFLGGVVGIGSGLALGREGPTVQMGGAIGALVADWTGSPVQERRELIAAGASAGLAAAFNAPLSGMVFVLEELGGNFSPGVFLTTLISAVTADVVMRALLGQAATSPVTTCPVPPLASELLFVLLGATAALAGIAFNRGLLACLGFFQKVFGPLDARGAALVGLLVGACAFWDPSSVGRGHHLTQEVLMGSMAPGLLALLFIVRYVLTLTSYGCGAPGGIFAPLLVLGSIHGMLFSQGVHRCFPGLSVPDTSFVVVAMAAYFTAIVRAPLTALVLITEMTLTYNLMLPLLCACTAAYLVAEAAHDAPLYDALMHRDLHRAAHPSEVQHTVVVEFRIRPGAPFDGLAVRDAGLPHGCVLATISRQRHSLVPDGSTVLRGGDEVTVVIGSQAEGALEVLRQGSGLA